MIEEEAAKLKVEQTNQISIDDVRKVDLRVGEILSAERVPKSKPIHPKKKKSKLSYHSSEGALETICKTSVTKYGALGKTRIQRIKNRLKRTAPISFLIKFEYIMYGIHAKKRFHIRYKRSVVPHRSRRAISKIAAKIDINMSNWVIFLIFMF